MAETMEKITFTTEDGEEAFFVLEQTRINGINYILVADSEEEEAEAMILREQTDTDEGEDAVYEIVEDEQELEAISRVFIEMMDDVEIELDKK